MDCTEQYGLSEGTGWLLSEWQSSVAAVLEAMTGERPAAAGASVAGAAKEAGGMLWWEQPLSLAPGAAVWIGAPEATWSGIGRRVLRAAGAGDSSTEDERSTYYEILGQAVSGLAGAIAGRRNQEVGCGKGEPRDGPPAGLRPHPAPMSWADGEDATFWIALTGDVCGGNEAAPGTPAAAADVDTLAAAAPSKTLDLLLDVEMPVAVSFGRAEMPLQDVLKLTAGSIVELNRSINEPVELIVNNCVVALGEVVVVDGSYGVRIQRIASREKRLWSTGGRPQNHS